MHSTNPMRHLDPLGEGFDPADREIDSRLSDLLRGASVMPFGLPDRVFDASAHLLPTAAARSAPQLRLVGGRSIRLRNQVTSRWIVSRVAMAASVALACAIGLKVCLPAAPTADDSANATNWAMFEELDSGYGSLSRLLQTNDMTLDDVTGELTMLVRAGEMEM